MHGCVRWPGRQVRASWWPMPGTGRAQAGKILLGLADRSGGFIVVPRRLLSAVARSGDYACMIVLAAIPAAAQMQGDTLLAGASPTPLRDPPTAYRKFRYGNEFESASAGVSDELKNLPLWSDTDVYVNLGGSLRERFEAFSQASSGIRAAGGVSGEQYDLYRLLLDADLHLGSSLRIFIQLGNHLEAGREPGPQPTDIDRLDVQQAFFDATAAGSEAFGAGLRGGRQEMAFGSNRLVDIREGPNIRQSFDGARAWLTAGEARLDAFWTRPVATARDISTTRQARRNSSGAPTRRPSPSLAPRSAWTSTI